MSIAKNTESNRLARRPSLSFQRTPFPMTDISNSMIRQLNTSKPSYLESRSWSSNSLKSTDDERTKMGKNRSLCTPKSHSSIESFIRQGGKRTPSYKNPFHAPYTPSCFHKPTFNMNPAKAKHLVLTDQPLLNDIQGDRSGGDTANPVAEFGRAAVHTLPASPSTGGSLQYFNSNVSEIVSFSRPIARQDTPAFVGRPSSALQLHRSVDNPLSQPHSIQKDSPFRPVFGGSPHPITYFRTIYPRDSRGLPGSGIQSPRDKVVRSSVPCQSILSLHHSVSEQTPRSGCSGIVGNMLRVGYNSGPNEAEQNGFLAATRQHLVTGSAKSKEEPPGQSTHKTVDNGSLSDSTGAKVLGLSHEPSSSPLKVIQMKRGHFSISRQSCIDNALRLPPLVLTTPVAFARPDDANRCGYSNSGDRNTPTLNENDHLMLQTWSEKSKGILKHSTNPRRVRSASSNSVRVSFNDPEQVYRSTKVTESPLSQPKMQQSFANSLRWSRESQPPLTLSSQPSPQNCASVNRPTVERGHRSDSVEWPVNRRSVASNEEKLNRKLSSLAAPNTTVGSPLLAPRSNYSISNETLRSSREIPFRGFNQSQTSSSASHNAVSSPSANQPEKRPQRVAFDLANNKCVHYLSAENSADLMAMNRMLSSGLEAKDPALEIVNGHQAKDNDSSSGKIKGDTDPPGTLSNSEAESIDILGNSSQSAEPRLEFKQNKLQSLRRHPKQGRRVDRSPGRSTLTSSSLQPIQGKSSSPRLDQTLEKSFVQEIHQTKYNTPLDVLKCLQLRQGPGVILE